MGFCLLVNLFKAICDYMYVFYIKKKLYTYVFHMNVYVCVFFFGINLMYVIGFSDLLTCGRAYISNSF